MIGAPPNCRPECLVSSECALDKSCINQKCKNPCEGVCGLHARCQVVNHNAICSCELGYSGDPFVRCIKEEIRKSNSNPFDVEWQFTIIFQSFVRSSNCTNHADCGLCPYAMRPEQPVPWGWRYARMLMLAQLYRSSTKLSTWVCYQFWVFSQFGLLKWTLCRSLRWRLLIASHLQCLQPPTDLSMSRWVHRRSICCLRSNSK